MFHSVFNYFKCMSQKGGHEGKHFNDMDGWILHEMAEVWSLSTSKSAS